ncbi:MAG TPA: hypothetical protein VH372_12250 [Actinospica sp.]|nr:hypothetical protein [Actinospica sp.]
MLGSQTDDACTAATDPSCAAVLQHSTGWHRSLTLPATVHGSSSDAEAIFPQLRGVLPDAVIEGDVGDAQPAEVLAEQEGLLSGFFHGWSCS